jgi:hypothetical protein
MGGKDREMADEYSVVGKRFLGSMAWRKEGGQSIWQI